MDTKTASLWGAIIVSVVTLLTFTGALIVSYFLNESNLLNLTVGAAIANATTAVGYWLGSSSGSQKKDDVIGAALVTGGGAVGGGATGAGGATGPGGGATGAGGATGGGTGATGGGR